MSSDPRARAFAAGKRAVLTKLLSPAEYDRSKVAGHRAGAGRAGPQPPCSPRRPLQKGGVDVAVADLVEFLNGQPDYVTTSSCSGRIAITSENPGYLKQVGGPPRPPRLALTLARGRAGRARCGSWRATTRWPLRRTWRRCCRS
jgi:hypothetical protein